jgi:hypothetical protein
MPSRMDATVLYTHVEGWWGDTLGPTLADAIADAPKYQLREFRDSWPEIPYLPLETLPRGVLRPAFPSESKVLEVTSAASRLLLYTPSVMLDARLLHPFSFVPTIRHQPWLTLDDRATLRWLFNWYASVRPLVEDDSIVFDTSSRGTHPSQSQGVRETLLAQPASVWSGTSLENLHADDLRQAIGELTYYLGGPLFWARQEVGTPVALTRAHEVAIEAVIGARRYSDRRATRLDLLARLELPNFSSGTESLVELRQSVEPLAQFRADLTRAVDDVTALPESDDAVEIAQGIIATGLEGSLSAVRAATRRSSLEGLVAGVRNLGLRALGTGAVAAASVVAGDPASAVGAAAQLGLDSATDFAAEYIEGRRSRRTNQAVKYIILSFRGQP